MQCIKSLSDIQMWRHAQTDPIVLVPTMGNLHAGHLALVKHAATLAPQVLVSIFVNPIQFSPGEDYDQYPRTLAEDCAALASLGLNVVVFAPPVREMYPQGNDHFEQTQISIPALMHRWCGASRPNLFVGAATVVMKLFNLIRPSVAVFGNKDFQQRLIIEKMALDLNVPIRIEAVPIMREPDGLAMSSRNRYLTREERQLAPRLYEVLQRLAASIQAEQAGVTFAAFGRSGSDSGSKGAACDLASGSTAHDVISGVTTRSDDYVGFCEKAIRDLTAMGFAMDYIAVCRQDNLLPATRTDHELVILAAGYLGKTRLIDNIPISAIPAGPDTMRV